MATRSNLFDKIFQGLSTFSSSPVWIELGVIPSGTKIMFGYGDYTPDGKNITFDLRSNISGQSTGTDANTTLHGRITVKDGNNGSADYYRNGRVSTLTVQSTGIEKVWMKVSSKTNGSADAYWWIYYTTI